METERPLSSIRMRAFEARALVYELPQIAAALVGGGLLGALAAWLVIRRGPESGPTAALMIFAGLAGLGLVGVFWAASYYLRRIQLFPDRLRFQMLFSHRDVLLSEIVSLQPLTPAEARKTFFSPRFMNLSPAVEGAVAMRRSRGRTWVFSPEDSEAWLDQVLARMGQPGEAPDSGGPAVAGSDPDRGETGPGSEV